MGCKERLLLEIKQGEDRNFGFTIKLGGEPFDLTDYQVLFQVKRAPFYKLESLIEKLITTTEVREVGHIYNPIGGQFKVQLSLDDYIKLPTGDYSLIITLLNGTNRIAIAGEGNASGVFRICYS